jgi:hypothetical protein
MTASLDQTRFVAVNFGRDVARAPTAERALVNQATELRWIGEMRLASRLLDRVLLYAQEFRLVGVDQ